MSYSKQINLRGEGFKFLHPFFKMGEINNLRKKMNAFVDNINVNVAIAVENVEDQLLKFNEDQLAMGKNKKGSNISPLYSEAYAKKKGFSIPDLKLTGDFIAARFVSVNENDLTYFVGSEDDKTTHLLERYGEDVLSVPENKQSDAKALTTKELGKMVKRQVFNG